MEDKPLGTIGSVSLLKGRITTPFFVSNCDSINEQDYRDVWDYHVNNHNDMTIVTMVKSFKIPYGVIETGEDGLMTALKEKPEQTYQVNTGVYILNPELINEITNHFGSQVCVCAIDARFDPDGWHCYVKGGRERTERGLFEWAKEVADRGAGEILFTSMDHDGTKKGFANEALARLSDELPIPIIASGGAGTMEHFRDAFVKGKADAALAASVFHFGEIGIQELKQYLRAEGINVRLN
jgi:imidazoleglycerol phosphate synthase cyclase subunit